MTLRSIRRLMQHRAVEDVIDAAFKLDDVQSRRRLLLARQRRVDHGSALGRIESCQASRLCGLNPASVGIFSVSDWDGHIGGQLRISA
jgi:hypothetical protein